MTVDPTPEHRWLARLVGEWTSTSGPALGFDFPGGSGHESVRALGEIWVNAVGDGEHGAHQMTLGFDPRTGRFVGTWVGAVGTHLWVYDGALDATGARLTLDCTGPSLFGGDALVPYRDVITLLGPDERTLEAWISDGKGGWTHFMTTRYRRVGG